MATTEKKISVAKAQLILMHPFFGSIVCKHPPVLTDKVPTAGVDARGNLFVNPKFVDTLSVQQVVFLLAHETMHVVYQHALRENSRNHEVWNIACDAVINPMLKQLGIGTFIEGGVLIPEYADKSAEAVYTDLMRKSEMVVQALAAGDRLSGDVDSSSAAGMTEAEKAETSAKIKAMAAEAMTGAKMRGSLPGTLEEALHEVLAKKVPWYELLERFMTSKASQEESWKRPNRRYMSVGYLPSLDSIPQMGTVVVGVDTSGSISNKELPNFFGHLNDIVEQCHPEKVVVVYCDYKVNKVDEFTPDDFPLESAGVTGGGGTDMTKIFDWVDESGEEPDAVIVFTDGFTPYPKDPTYSTMWAVTTDTEVPDEAGEVIRVEVE